MALPELGASKWRHLVESVELLQALWSPERVEVLKLREALDTCFLDAVSNQCSRLSSVGVPWVEVPGTDGG